MFKPGDEVICIQTHSQGVVIKGKIYTVRDVVSSPCGCMSLLDVGLKTNRPLRECNVCGNVWNADNRAWLVGSWLFKKLLTDNEEKDLEEAISELLTGAN
jgi:hypothetical protein